MHSTVTEKCSHSNESVKISAFDCGAKARDKDERHFLSVDIQELPTRRQLTYFHVFCSFREGYDPARVHRLGVLLIHAGDLE